MGHRYENILGTVGNTPVVRINRLAPPDVNFFVKIESFNPLSSVKDRLALGVIEAAEKSGDLKPGQTVVEATSGNTGIGLAMVCAQKGYPLVIVMAETFSVERRLLMRFFGAKVILTPMAAGGVAMLDKATELAEKYDGFHVRQFENEANPDMHSRTTAREIIEDFSDTDLVLGDRVRNRWHAQRRFACATERASRHQDRCMQAGRLANTLQWLAARKQSGRIAVRASPCCATPPNAGLEPTFPSQDHG